MNTSQIISSIRLNLTQETTETVFHCEVKEKAAAKYCDFRNSEDFNLNQKALNFLYVFHYNKKLVKEIILSDSDLDQ